MARGKFPKNNGVKETTPAAEAQRAEMQRSAASPQSAEAALAQTAMSEETTKAEAKRPRSPKIPAPKLEAVRTESRSNVVPINLEDEIRRLAYLLSERRGFEPGHENEDWLAAEHEVLQRYRQHGAQSA
jgi:hypothetical protein